MAETTIPSSLLAEEVLAVCEQLKNKEKITVKIGFASSVAGFFLARLIKEGDLGSAPVLAVCEDETAKMNLWTYAFFYLTGKMPQSPEAAQFLMAESGLPVS